MASWRMSPRSKTQHEQFFVSAEMCRLGQFDLMNDWDDDVLDLRNETMKHDFTQAVMAATFDEFEYDEATVPEASDEPSASSSIHGHHDRCKRSNTSEDTWFWPNTKGWMSFCAFLVLIALIIWVSSHSVHSCCHHAKNERHA